jgi:hypothetical protein
VVSISLFTELVNQDLEGGRIRLPLKDLLELRSRPISEVAIMADFKGDAGSKCELFHRTMQHICVDTCNRHHWLIPFQQVRVGMANPSDRHG